ncbi:MAG: hypothetical protein HUU35_05415, partial [Armatimonadetes bacterium]|nr:hypothetical protein [Armatimonadota bacterium]
GVPVFASSQVKYGLYQNYLHRYLDRPLLMDRATRGPGVLTEASFHKIIGHTRLYGLDGLSILIGTAGMVDRYERALAAADSSGQASFVVMPRLGVSRDITWLDRTLKAALASPHTFRVGGKVLCGGYSSDRLPPAEIAAMLKDLRAIHGDTFLFCGEFDRPFGLAFEEHRRQGQVSAATTEQVRATLRSYLEVADGLFLFPSMYRTPERRFDADFYRNYTIPVVRGILAEEPYREKYLGAGAVTGYFNFMTGSTLSEDGTKTLRRSFEAAVSASPDFIDLPEWDELNEHTCLEPTITNSFSTQRIIKYYQHVQSAEPPQPNPGDDLTIPNLVVSYRKALTLGEKLEIELLNVPDGQGQPYRVQVALLDPAGQTVCELPAEDLAADVLADVTWSVATETLAGHLLLRPRVSVTTAAGPRRTFDEGLMHVTLRPTANYDYKWVRQPLRDVCRPSQAVFEAQSEGNGAYRLSGRYAGDEPLAFLEVLENGDEVYGVDVSNEYPDRRDTLLLDVTMRAMREHRPFQGKLSIEGATATIHTPTDGRYYFNRGNALEINFWLNVWPRGGLLSLPRTAAEGATLVLDFNLFKHRIPVAKVLPHGVYSETLPDGITITLEDYRRLPDVTPHVGRPEASFDFRLTPRQADSVLWMRAITQSGRLYRSAPLRLAPSVSGRAVSLDVFSETAGRPTKVQVEEASIPSLEYRLEPANGSLFITASGRTFWGHLGGREIDATGVGGGEAGGMGDPFRSGEAYPKEARHTAPRYVVENGRPCLEFDGLGNYVVFPREVTPRRGAWTLDLEILPTSPKKQVLFCHHGHYRGSVCIYLENGEIHSDYTDHMLTTTVQRPGLKLPLGEWSQVRVSYNLATITYTVNGRQSEPLPAPGPGLYLGSSVFGGLGSGGEYFQGRLRALRMVHRAL